MKRVHKRVVVTKLLLLGFAVAIVASACVDVGHDAETGCLKDMTLPGCSPDGSAKGGAASKSSAVGDAGAAGGTQ